MSDQEVDDSVIKADHWSKIIALFVAIGIYLVGAQLTNDGHFSMIVAAFTGIGVRIYIPYHASILVSDPDHKPIQAYEGSGNYHQGAVGAAVVIASLAALVVMLIEANSTTAFVAGTVVAIASFLLFRLVLPS